MISTVSQTGFPNNRKDDLYIIDLIWMFAGYIWTLPSFKLYFVHHDFCINFDVGKYCIKTLLILIKVFF